MMINLFTPRPQQNSDPRIGFQSFSQVVDPSVYHPIPDDWVIGLTDVVDSTGAIASGSYKSVNMAGAAGISAVMNALKGVTFPFVFGGDGCSFAVPPEHVAAATEALARTSQWVGKDLNLELRAAMVPVSAIRAAGHEFLLGWFAASDAVSYAVFSGGGVTWAENAMKSGRYAVPPAPADARPNLLGLSCRWSRIPSKKGQILSLIVRPAADTDPQVFADLVLEVLTILDLERGGTPIPPEGPEFGLMASGAEIEARSMNSNEPLWRNRLSVYFIGLAGWLIFKIGKTVKGFDPVRYRRYTGLNSDFRKFDDGLRMTVDCDETTAARLKARLEEAKQSGIARHGIHQQSEALMTCVVPSIMDDAHFHFLDGADGGYAQAARQL